MYEEESRKNCTSISLLYVFFFHFFLLLNERESVKKDIPVRYIYIYIYLLRRRSVYGQCHFLCRFTERPFWVISIQVFGHEISHTNTQLSNKAQKIFYGFDTSHFTWEQRWQHGDYVTATVRSRSISEARIAFCVPFSVIRASLSVACDSYENYCRRCSSASIVR